jgi:hypothetical protein
MPFSSVETTDPTAILLSVVEQLDQLKARLAQLELATVRLVETVDTNGAALAKVGGEISDLCRERTVKEAYTTAEVAEKLGKRPFTVREWCRLGRVHAQKRACGRGESQDWAITHAELLRIQNDGLLPAPKY